MYFRSKLFLSLPRSDDFLLSSYRILCEERREDHGGSLLHDYREKSSCIQTRDNNDRDFSIPNPMMIG